MNKRETEKFIAEAIKDFLSHGGKILYAPVKKSTKRKAA